VQNLLTHCHKKDNPKWYLAGAAFPVPCLKEDNTVMVSGWCSRFLSHYHRKGNNGFWLVQYFLSHCQKKNNTVMVSDWCSFSCRITAKEITMVSGWCSISCLSLEKER